MFTPLDEEVHNSNGRNGDGEPFGRNGNDDDVANEHRDASSELCQGLRQCSVHDVRVTAEAI